MLQLSISQNQVAHNQQTYGAEGPVATCIIIKLLFGYIYKILDYITIFKTMKQERDLMEPMWHEVPFKIPVLRYMKAAVQSHPILKEISW